ncbi:MAG: O-antigen ligase family protein [Desulfobacterales bacterium]|nr:O-antigen ligase family protein [Desulfobacterales bacterium]
MPKHMLQNEDQGSNFSFWIILALNLLLPVLVLPNLLDNSFNSPKFLLILAGVFLLIAIYSARFVLGWGVLKPGTSTPKWIIILILLNFISFFYTDNYYFTKTAALMNITCLLFFFFVSIYVDTRKVLWIIWAVAVSGILVSILTYLQFTGHHILFRWAHGQGMVTATIGNSNYLGAYLLFPLFALSGLFFLLKGKLRWIPALLFFFVFGAFLCSRARASWLALGISLPVLLISIKCIYSFSISEYLKTRSSRVVGYGIVIIALMVCLWSVAPQRFHTMMKIENWTETTSLKYRWTKYFRSSLWLFKQSPLFGTGLWSYRNMVYDAQAEINKIDPEYFKDYGNPKPRRVHNEYLEILNDGGLVAAAFLLILFSVVMRHGWRLIRDETVKERERIIAAIAFASLVAIMIAALNFFAFRINSTLFMTALMMGIMEGVYLKTYGLVSKTEGQRFPCAYIVIFLVFLILISIFSFRGYRPFKGELAFFQYRKAMAQRNAKQSEKYVLKAISYDPDNSQYCLYAGQLYMDILRDYPKAGEFFERAIINFNGDLTKWSVYYGKGLLKYRMGSLFEARSAFEKSIYYYPLFKPANEKLKEVNKVLKDHKQIMIKLR